MILWDLRTGDVLQQFTAREQAIFAVAFTTDEGQIIAAYGDSTVVWFALDGTVSAALHIDDEPVRREVLREQRRQPRVVLDNQDPLWQRFSKARRRCHGAWRAGSTRSRARLGGCAK